MLKNNQFTIKHNTKIDPVEFNKKQKDKLKKFWSKEFKNNSNMRNSEQPRIGNMRLDDIDPLDAKRRLIQNTIKQL